MNNSTATPAVPGRTTTPPGRRGWDPHRLADYAAHGTLQSTLRRIVENHEDERSYAAWWQHNQHPQLPNPRTPAIDPGDTWVHVAGDPGYPNRLLHTFHPPFLLYGRGYPQALDRAGIAVVGTENITALGEAITSVTVAAAAELDAPVIAGLSTGVDATAHHASISHGLPTVAVLPTGVSATENPAAVEAIIAGGGAVISEHPHHTGIDHAPHYQPHPLITRAHLRHRIIAGLSALAVPAEGTLADPAMNTVWAALQLGRPVIVALPKAAHRRHPGAGIATALADPTPASEISLIGAGAPQLLAATLAGTAPLATVAHERADLTTLTSMAYLFSPLVDATASRSALTHAA